MYVLGGLCRWKSSLDKFAVQRHLVSNRRRRQNPYVTRGWLVLNGTFAPNQTIDKSGSLKLKFKCVKFSLLEIFSLTNKRFVATHLRPQQKSIMIAKLDQTDDQPIVLNFNFWEATKNLQLRACCDNITNCPFESDMGLKRGTRRWLNNQLVCPSGTNRVNLTNLKQINAQFFRFSSNA